ncbi:hypothetical protein QR680_017487 [Steinernema hermaphroditum]|uniref:Reticulon-like protein n=1 Tax=Steinernema hermaphroditum TaxID=289476 RepID=A0AA39LNR3_9BILA|nr:hypothetical protein QR680_017487 [Steinernema hermaphroditum]
MADSEHHESPVPGGEEERKSASPTKIGERDFEYISHFGEGDAGALPSPPVMVSSQINTDEFDPFLVKPHTEKAVHSAMEDLLGSMQSEVKDSIQTGVDTVHDEIDSVLHRISPTPPVSSEPISDLLFEEPQQSLKSPVAKVPSEVEESEAADVPGLDFSVVVSGQQRPFYGVHVRYEEPEETYERSGPLTIPIETVAKNLEDALAESIVSHSIAEAAEISTKPNSEPAETPEARFETVPRPPTPPKDISDEEQQPTSLDLGPPPTHSQSGSVEHPKSILKQSSFVDLGALDSTIKELVYWRDPKKSATVLSLLVLILVVLTRMSVVSLLSYGGLLLLIPLLGYRCFTLAQVRLKKTQDVHPFGTLLKSEITVPRERVHHYSDVVVSKLSVFAKHVRHLLLVEDFGDSIKFGLILWALSHVGHWFSGLALAFISVIGVFSVPKFYEVYQQQIDAQITVIQGHLQKMHDALAEKIPPLKPKAD